MGGILKYEVAVVRVLVCTLSNKLPSKVNGELTVNVRDSLDTELHIIVVLWECFHVGCMGNSAFSIILYYIKTIEIAPTTDEFPIPSSNISITCSKAHSHFTYSKN